MVWKPLGRAETAISASERIGCAGVELLVELDGLFEVVDATNQGNARVGRALTGFYVRKRTLGHLRHQINVRLCIGLNIEESDDLVADVGVPIRKLRSDGCSLEDEFLLDRRQRLNHRRHPAGDPQIETCPILGYTETSVGEDDNVPVTGSCDKIKQLGM